MILTSSLNVTNFNHGYVVASVYAKHQWTFKVCKADRTVTKNVLCFWLVHQPLITLSGEVYLHKWL